MRISVEQERYLGVRCGADEQIVFDKRRDNFHLVRGLAARVWEKVGEGGTFQISEVRPLLDAGDADDFTAFSAALDALEEAQLLCIQEETGGENADLSAAGGINRRAWFGLTGRVAAATVLPLVISLAAPSMVLGQNGDRVSPGDGNTEPQCDPDEPGFTPDLCVE